MTDKLLISESIIHRRDDGDKEKLHKLYMGLADVTSEWMCEFVDDDFLITQGFRTIFHHYTECLAKYFLTTHWIGHQCTGVVDVVDRFAKLSIPATYDHIHNMCEELGESKPTGLPDSNDPNKALREQMLKEIH